MVFTRALLVIFTLACWCCQVYAQGTGEPAGRYLHSLILMRYDVGRDVKLVETVSFTTNEKRVSSQQYADVLAARPEMNFSAIGQNTHYRNPAATVRGDTLTVNYRDSATEASMTSAESMDFWTRFASWFWMPGIHQVRFYANGKEVVWIGEGEITQPLTRVIYLFLYNLNTHEVGIDWQDSRVLPERATLTDALRALRERRKHQTGRLTGFEPLLPPGMTIATPEYPRTPLTRSGGVLHIDLPAAFPRNEQGRLAGIVLLLAQFSEVQAVRFTFGGKTMREPFMRTTLDAPITPHDLELPQQQIKSVLRFSYDIHTGNAVTPVTEERATALTPLEYARALAHNPAMQWTPPLPNTRYVHPRVSLQAGSLVVRYTVEGRYPMSSSELAGLWAMLEAWWWVPGVREVTLLDQHGNTLPIPEYGTLERPAPRRYQTYAYLADRYTMGYLTGVKPPQSLHEALNQLAQRMLGDQSSSPRVQPLLPEGVRITADTRHVVDGVLPVDLSAPIHQERPVRLAGVVMMLTQFPEVQAVRFTFNGEALNDPFMRTTLSQPVTPYDLEFSARPTQPIYALLLNGQTYAHVRPLVERFGGTTAYNPQTREVHLTIGKRRVVLMAGNSAAWQNGEPLYLWHQPPRLIDDRLFVPVRPVAAALGLGVTWTGATRNVSITTAGIAEELTLPVTTSPVLPPASPGIHPLIDATQGYLIGGIAQQRWLDHTAMRRFWPATASYRLYSLTHAFGAARGARRQAESYFGEITLQPTVRTNAMAMGLAASWNALPRRPQTRNAQSATYQRITRDMLRRYGMPAAPVHVEQAVQVDLDGDGTEELLICASRLSPNSIGVHAEAGDYSFIMLRTRVHGQARDYVLAGELYPRTGGHANVYRIAGVLDVDGDGRQEVQIGYRWYDGQGQAVYRIKGERIMLLFHGGASM